MSKKRIKIFAILIFFVAISTFLYFDAFATLTSYESTIDADVNTTGAKFAVAINGTNIVTSDGSVKDLDITSAVTSSTHIKANTVAPGSKLDIPLNINFYGSEVSVIFDIDVVDKTINSDKALTLKSIVNGSNAINLVRTGPNKYTGVINVSDITNVNHSYTLKFEFDDEDIYLKESLTETSSEDLFVINFSAFQYMGETITPYS